MPMLPLPSPIFCAAALRLCSCKRLVALELPPIVGDEVIVSTEVVSAAMAEGGRANVVEVDVEVVGAAAMLEVAVTGDVPAVGMIKGDTDVPVVIEFTLDTLLADPCV